MHPSLFRSLARPLEPNLRRPQFRGLKNPRRVHQHNNKRPNHLVFRAVTVHTATRRAPASFPCVRARKNCQYRPVNANLKIPGANKIATKEGRNAPHTQGAARNQCPVCIHTHPPRCAPPARPVVTENGPQFKPCKWACDSKFNETTGKAGRHPGKRWALRFHAHGTSPCKTAPHESPGNPSALAPT